MALERVAVALLVFGVCSGVGAMTLDTVSLHKATGPQKEFSWLGHPVDIGEEFEPAHVLNLLPSAWGDASSLLGGRAGSGPAAGLQGNMMQAGTFLEHVMRSMVPGEGLVNAGAGAGMRMTMEIKKLSAGTKFFAKFAHGCKPTPGRMAVNCTFAFGDSVNYMWALRSNSTTEEGDSVFFSVAPKLIEGHHHPTLLAEKTWKSNCPACGTMCMREVGPIKVNYPSQPCGTPHDLGVTAEYKIPTSMPSSSFVGIVRVQKKDGTVNAVIKVNWDIA